jgi:hypothetical protein
MKKPFIIAINSVSGGGKTALAKVLQQSLPASVVFCFDDFDQMNQYPEDYYDWWKRGADLREFDSVGMAKAIDDEIQRGAIEFIIMDYPFGRHHPQVSNVNRPVSLCGYSAYPKNYFGSRFQDSAYSAIFGLAARSNNMEIARKTVELWRAVGVAGVHEDIIDAWINADQKDEAITYARNLREVPSRAQALLWLARKLLDQAGAPML